ncbi:MAG TPA: hypothetical protein VGV88_13060 [Candidatus Dormibacteraeota bacterium]|nr:hypothetical protein [Candidatus Dormibacteraeota bacterium]
MASQDRLKERWTRLLANRRFDSRPAEPTPGPATSAEVEDLEGRLGRSLPPSYHALLTISSAVFPGWSLQPSEVDVLPRKEPFTSVLWVNPHEFPFPLFDIEGSVAKQLLARDRHQDCLNGHLLHAIVVCRSDGNFVLLDPLDADADGEWRAWDWWNEGCEGLYRSLVELMEAKFARSAEQPAATQQRIYQDTEIEMLAAQLEGGEADSHIAASKLEARVREQLERGRERWQPMHALVSSSSEAARSVVKRLMDAYPDDPVVIGKAISADPMGELSPETDAALRRALLGPNRSMFASSVVWQRRQIVDDVWRATGDPVLLNELVRARQPGTIRPAIDMLMDDGLEPKTRSLLTYTLSHTTRYHPDPPEPDALLAAARLPENDRVHLAQALLGWREVESALQLLGPELEEYFPPSGIGMVAYLLNAIAEMAPPEAVPVLIASIKRQPTAQVLRTLAFIDHPETVPAIASQLDGELRTDALIALEQLATPAALDLLAERAHSGDIQCARALARHRDRRAFGPLVAALDGKARRDAVTGLRDLRYEEAVPLLEKVIAEDPNDDVATIAAHGVVMTTPAAAGAVRTLARRADPDIQALSEHWLSLLP